MGKNERVIHSTLHKIIIPYLSKKRLYDFDDFYEKEKKEIFKKNRGSSSRDG